MCARTLLAAILLCSAGQTAFAENIYVDASAPSAPPGDGSSWKSAFNDLQDALAVAKPGDEIRIAQGTYKPAPPDGPREATFNLVDGVTIQGGYAGVQGEDPNALDHEQFQTILSGDLNSDDGPNFANYDENVYHLVTAQNLSSLELRGLTIRGGSALTPALCDGPHFGAGILANDSSLTLIHCRITANRAVTSGAGVYAAGGSVEIRNSQITDNRVFIDFFQCHNAPCSGAGAGLLASHALVSDTLFSGNGYSACGVGGGAFVGEGSLIERCVFISNGAEFGGGLAMSSSTVIDSVFQNNGASAYGGGLRNTGNSTVVNCRFISNGSAFCGGGVYGGGVTFINCLFHGNDGGSSGAAHGTYLTLINCTVVGNGHYASMYSYGPGIVSGVSFTAINSIIWGNGSQQADMQTQQLWFYPNTTTQIQNCCIQGWTGALGGSGNHGNDPRFVDAANGDYRLRANSPAIEGGDNDALPPDEFDLDEDGDTAEAIPFDLDWLPRIVNKVVDVGAFEFQGAPCRADINGDSAVTVDDLLALLFSWGSCAPGQSCDNDLNLDGQVNTDDLLELLQGWGACP